MRSSRSNITEKAISKNKTKHFTKMRLTLIASFIVIALMSTAAFSSSSAAGSLSNLLFGSASLLNFLSGNSAAVQSNDSTQSKSFLDQEPSSSDVARSGHTATDLGGGKVLLVGGDANGSTSIFDVGAGTFAASGSLSVPRTNHTATKLSDGRVLIAGGDSGNGAGLNSTEIYDPATGSFTAGPNLTTGRTGQTATLMPDGTILIVGGDIAGSAEILDINQVSALVSAQMSRARSRHSAALMKDGRVLIVGGRDADGNELESVEIFDGTSFSATSNAMKLRRVRPLLRVLPDGKVQIIGGNSDGSMEVYDPVIDTVGAYAHVVPESDPCANLINYILSSPVRAALIYNGSPVSERNRSGYTVTELGNKALVAGGTDSNGNALASIILFDSSSATITTDKLDYSPGETAIISGTGFQPGETVRVKIHEDPHTPNERGFDAAADEKGNFTGTYLVMDYDLSMKFIIGARGLSSGFTAQTTFTDADNTGDYRSAQTGDWHTLTTWERFNGTTWAAPTVAQGYPGQNGTPTSVTIQNSHVVTVNLTVPNPVGSAASSGTGLTVNGTLNLNVNLTIANGGSVTVNNSGSIVFNSSATINGGGSGSNGVLVNVNAGANLTTANPLGFVANGGSGSISITRGNRGGPNYDTGANYTFNGTNAQNTGTGITGANNLTINNSAGVTLSANTTVNGALNVTGTFANGGFTLSGAGSWTVNSGGTVNWNHASAPGISGAKNFHGNSTFNYNASGAQTIGAYTYGNLATSGSGTKTLGGAITVAGNLTIGSGTTLDVSTNNYGIDLAGNWTNAGTFTRRSGTVTFNGTTQSISGSTTGSSGTPQFNIVTIAIGSTTTNNNGSFMGTLNVNNGAKYIHDNSGTSLAGTTSTRNFASSSTIEIKDHNSSALPNTTYGNLIINNTNLSGAWQQSGNLNNINGNLTIISTGSSSSNEFRLTTSTPTNLSIGGKLSIQGGTVVASSGTAATSISVNSETSISSGAKLDLQNGSGNNALNLFSNWTNDGTFTPGGSTVTFNGIGIQTIGGSNATTFNNLTISNGTSLNSVDATVNGTLALNSILITGSNKVIANGSVTRTSGFVRGNLQKPISSGASAPTFEIGTGTTYTPINLSISGASSGGNLTASSTAAQHPSHGTSGISASKYVNRYWALTAGGGLTVTSYDAAFTFVSGDLVGSPNTGALIVRKFNGPSTWTAPSSSSSTSTTATATGFNSFSDFAIGESTCVAPSISTQPTDSTITYGQNAAFSAAADGTPSPTLQWEFSTDGGNNWNNVPGATSSPLNITAPTISQSGTKYRAVFSNGCGGNVISNAATLTVNQKTVAGSFTADNKVYDGNTNATILTRTINSADIVGSDAVTLEGGSATFDDKNVGTGKTVTGSGFTLGGANAGNYQLGTVATTTANITPKNLTINGAVANNKAYDGTTAATVNFAGASLSGVIDPDVVSLDASSYTADFDNQNIGTGKSVTVTGVVLGGAGASNYTVSQPSGLTADITPKNLTITGAAANSKAYDGTQAATVNFAGASLSGVVGSETVTIDISSYSASFNDKNVGTGKPVTVSGVALGGANAGNYTVSQPGGLTADITAATLTGAFTANNKPYDGTDAATIASRSITGGVVGSEDVTLTGGTAAFDDKNVGNGKTVTGSGFTLGGADAGNYQLGTVPTTTADITARSLTVSATGIDKVYDGTTAATVNLTTNDKINGDDVTLSYTGAAFADKSVGNGKSVSVSGISIGGADAVNYALANTTAETTANITPRTLNITATGINKVYDGTTAATVNLNGDGISGDAVTLSYSASFADKNVGTGKTVNVTDIAISGGADAGNYTLGNTTTSTTADITAKTLTVTATAQDKEYDGNADASVTLSIQAGGVISGESVGASFTSAAFDDKNVGTGKTVTVNGIILTGADAGNYTANNSTTTTASITAKALTPNITVDNKTYDGTTAATITGRSLSGAVSSDDVSLTGGTATFSDANVGNGKTVTGTGFSLAGTAAGNYTLGSDATTTANITPKSVTATITASHKEYDGNANATITGCSLSGVINPDTTGCAASATAADNQFENKTVGNGKTVTANNISLTDNAFGNYALSSATAQTTANITAKALTATVTAGNKEYDGNQNAVITACSFTGAVSGDEINCVITGYSASFDNKNVGTGKTVTAAGLSKDGADSGNYTFGGTGTGTADITAKALTATVAANNKSYDGNAVATISGCSFAGVINGDTVDCETTGYSASFNDKNVGMNKPVTASGLSKAGASAGNYSFDGSGTGTAAINPISLTATVTASNKQYDGNADAVITACAFSGGVSGDSVNCEISGYSASFNNSSVGTGKPVSASGLTKSGDDAGNYTFGGTGTGSADITAKALTATVTASNKPYDGNAVATITGCAFSGVVGGDTVNCEITGYSASFGNPNAGTGKTVTASGLSKSGSSAGNYSFDGTGTGSADITAKLVTASVTASGKTYDGNANAAITSCSLSGVINGDTTGCAASLNAADNQFSDKTVGSGKTVTANNISLTDNAAGNYALSSATANTTANITPLHITGSFTADNKEYDGNMSATVLTRALNGAIGGDDVSLDGGAASFDTKDVGNGKTVTLTGASLAGGDAGNYILDSVSTATANITVKGLTATVVANNKPYDGNNTAAISSCSFSGVVNGDTVNCEITNYSAAFNDKTVGTAKPVTASGLIKSGADANNYSFNGNGTGSADITAISLTATVNANNKIYDGTASATLSSCSFTGVVSGDTVNCVTNGYSASFDNQNVGTGKPVNASGLTKSGTDSGNYNFDGTGTGSANITPKNATWTTNPNNKYFGQADPNPLTTGSESGFIGADGVTATYSRAAGSNAGQYQITATLSSAVSGALNNYNIINNGAIFTINPDPTALTLDTNNDGINFDCQNNTYKATLKDTINNQGVSGVTLKMTIGSQSATAVTNGGGEATFTLILSQNPGTVTQKVEVDSSFIWSNTNLVAPAPIQRNTFVISGNTNVGPGQDADSLYTGSLWFWTSSSTSSTATLTLSATVKDTFAFCPGDITKAKVSFLISTNGGTSFSPVSNAQNLPVGLVNPNDTTTGTASAISQYNIGSSQSVTLTVRVVVGGQYNYSGSTFDTTISIGKPGQANSLMGGGKLRNDGVPFPANGYLGANSIKSEFGTQVTYTKSGTNPKGDVTVTIASCNKPDGSAVEGCTKYTPNKWRTYFIKSNAISELSLISGSASFGSKTNVSEVLPDGSKVGLDGGNTMQLVFTPYGKPFPTGMAATTGNCMNSSGCASIVIYRSNGLGGGVWYSSAWGQVNTSAPKTYLKNVVGGNVTVQ